MGRLKEDLTRAGLELIETHTAWVFLDEATVWKIKKPVDFGFLDYTPWKSAALHVTQRFG